MAGWHGWLLGTRGMGVRMRFTRWSKGFGFASVDGSSGLDGIDDLLVTCAPAKIAFNGTSNFLTGRIFVFVEQSL